MKIYLGDGAYAMFTGYSVVVTAENGTRATDTVSLEPEALKILVEFTKTFWPNICE